MRLPQQMYDERLVTPMRQELTRLGVKELRTPEEVDETLKNAKGTTLVVVNSVCGCSARMARPAVAIALQNPIKPDRLTTVFAGQDAEATERARELLHRLCAIVAADRAAQGWRDRLHARALADRRTAGRRDRA